MDAAPVRFEGLLHEVDGLAVRAVVSRAAGGSDAPAFVLVHGLGLSHRYMMPVAEALARRGAQVYAPDLPGFGDSGHPPRVLDVDGLGDALGNWLAAAELRHAWLLGNSFGCQIIAACAERRPERIAGCILQGPTTPPAERTWLQQWIRWRQNAPFTPPPMTPIARDDYRRCGYPRLWRTFRLSLRDRLEDRLPGIALPVLVVRGQRDPICRAGWAARVSRALPDGRLAEIPNVAHTLCFTAPEQLSSVCMTFVAELRRWRTPSGENRVNERWAVRGSG